MESRALREIVLYCGLLLLLGFIPMSAAAQKIEKIVIEGRRFLAEETVRSFIGAKEGENFSADQVTKDIKALFSSGFVDDVRVEKESLGEGPEAGIVLRYIIVEKPMVDKVEFRGNKQLRKDELEELVQIKPRSVYDPAKVAQARARILEEYAKKGNLLTEVHPEIEPVGENRVNVVFQIDESPKPSVEQVTFFGNENIKDSDLERVMTTRKDLPVITSQKYTQSDFERDLYVLQYYYQDKGYLEAEITHSERLLTPDGRHVRLGIGVEEGKQYTVSSISIKGDLLGTEEQLKEGFKLKEGEVFSRSLFEQDIQYLTDRYGDEGYALVDIKHDLKADHEKCTVDLTYNIRKGKKVYLESIYMTGNELTQDKVIRREMTVKEGQLYSTRELRQSQARIQRLGYFSEVAFIPRPGTQEDRLNLEIAVKEQQSGSFTAGAGYSSTENFFFTASYQQRNFLGLGQEIAIQAMISDRSQSYYIDFNDPRFLDSLWRLGFSLFSTETTYVQFQRQSLGGSLTFGRQLPNTETSHVFLTYAFTQNNIESYAKSSTIYRKQPADNKTGSLKVTFQRRAVDNVLDPTKGNFLMGVCEVAGFGVFGGDNDFVKTELDSRLYQPVYKGTYAAARARIRMMSFDMGDRLLVTERYFMGGPHSMRGYDYGAVSPTFKEDDGHETPIGGNKDVLLNLEYILPLAPAMGMKLVLFYDIGNVYNDNEPIDLTNLRQDWGVGIRWFSPMGPLRFEMGFPIDPRP